MEDWYLERVGHPGTRHHLNILLNGKDKLTVGRKAGGSVDIVCNGKTVSREHCILKYVDNSWNVEDLKSMNGVYLNKNKVAPSTPVTLKLGDILGVGAVEPAGKDFYVFAVHKTVIKAEIVKTESTVTEETCSSAVPIAVELNIKKEPNSPIDLGKSGFKHNTVSDSVIEGMGVANLPRRSGLASSVQPESATVVVSVPPHMQPKGDTSNSNSPKICVIGNGGELKNSPQVGVDSVCPRVTQTHREKTINEDPKLKMKCIVLLKKLTESYIKQATKKKTTLKKVKGRRRVFQPIDSEDDEDSNREQNPVSSSPICWIPKNLIDDCVQKSKNEPVVSTKGKALKGSTYSSKGNAERVTETKANHVALPSTSNAFAMEENSSSSDIFEEIVKNPIHRKSNSNWEDEVIILSSDEETFSVPNFKFKTTDVERPSSSNSESGKSDNDPLNLVPNSLDEDSPFFPELSQPFLNEIEAEEKEEEEEEEARTKKSNAFQSEKEHDGDKLQNLLAHPDRFKPKGKITQLTEPQAITPQYGSSRHSSGRFPLTTASDSSRKDTDAEPEERINNRKVQAHPPPNELTNPRKPSSNFVSRTTQQIPMRPQNSRKKKPTGIGAIKAHFAKSQDLESYVRSVNDASSKNPSAPMPQSEIRQPVTAGAARATKQSIEHIPKSTAPIPVKAKVTKRSRGDMLTADLVNKEKVGNEGGKKTSSLAGYSIPKKAKLDNGDGATAGPSSSGEVQKRTLDADDLELNIEIPDPFGEALTATSYAFKPAPKRVARIPNSGADNGKNGRKSLPQPANKIEHNRTYKPGPASSKVLLAANKGIRDPRVERGNANGRTKELLPSSRVNGSHKDGTLSVSIERQLDEAALNSNESTTPSTNDVTLPLSTIDCDSRPSSANGRDKTGILVYGGSRSSTDGKPKRRISFGENQIRMIEARGSAEVNANSNAAYLDSQLLITDMLLRICNWSYNWIAEQLAVKDEPPPLLNEVKAENNRILPKLMLRPVVSAYSSIEAYFAIFHPLMLHEVWANICKDVESDPLEWKTLLRANTTPCSGSVLLQCETIVPNGAVRFKDMDLITLTVPLPNQSISKVFGVVHDVQMRRIIRRENIDPRLLATSSQPDHLVTFTLRVKPSNVPSGLDGIFTVTRVTQLKTMIRQFQLNAELDRSLLCDVILHPTNHAEAFKLEKVDVGEIKMLNAVQHKAVESITKTIVDTLAYVPKVALLQGPPGTGKSHVIVQLVLRLLEYHYMTTRYWQRILICAPSNNAIDEIANRLMKAVENCKGRLPNMHKLKMVRIGVPSAMHSGVRSVSLDVLASEKFKEFVNLQISSESPTIATYKEELVQLKKNKHALIASIDAASKKGQQDEARLYGRKLEIQEAQIEAVQRSLEESQRNHARQFSDHREHSKIEVIRDANIICTTLNSCRSKEMEHLFLAKPGDDREGKPRFLCCIIDEASQCTEPESLTPLSLGISKLVLIGDPDQLPATVSSQCSLKYRFDQSLFNRFYASRMSSDLENNDPVMMLNTQYRMCASICEWPSKYFYGGKLLTAPNLPRMGPCHDYRVLNVLDGQEKLNSKDGRSTMNEKEATLVANIIRIILDSPMSLSRSIGVITFYQAQRHCIISAVQKRCPKDHFRVEINTVDSFQGREKDIVVVSCVRARETIGSGDIGFINSLQRMNVALTRARESLIVCCHFPTLETNEAWRDLLDNARSRKVAHNVTSDYTETTLRPLIMR